MIKTVIRRFHSFKRPPADYIFKREVVPSDLDGTKLNQFDCENEKWCNDIIHSGKNLYYPKYGSSIYDDDIIKERLERLNSRED